MTDEPEVQVEPEYVFRGWLCPMHGQVFYPPKPHGHASAAYGSCPIKPKDWMPVYSGPEPYIPDLDIVDDEPES